MRHLTPEEFVDLAEGARAEASTPHLRTCDACQRQLDELRAMMSAAADVEAPEPSPLFWDHFSARVGAAVASEGAPRRSSWFARGPWGLALPLALGAAAAVALAVAMTLGRRPSPAGPEAAPPALEAAAPAAASSLTWPDDPSLGLVASLAAGYDWDAASEAGLTTSLERADTAIGDLSPAERQELERLLKQEMRRPGA